MQEHPWIRQESQGSQSTGVGGLHVVVGRALEDLQSHVTAEVRRLQSLLDAGPLRAPMGDAPVPEPTNRTSHVAVSSWQKKVKEDPLSQLVEVKAVNSQHSVTSAPDKGANFGAMIAKASAPWTSNRSELHALKAKHFDLQHAQKKQMSMDVSHLEHRPPTWVQKLVGSHPFEVFWIIVVVANSILLGVQTQWAAGHIGELEPLAFRVVQHLFSFMFVVELALRITAVGCRAFFLGANKAWAILDTVIVIASLLEFFVETALSLSSNGINGDNFRTVRIIRLFRFLRAFRIERIIHLVSGLRTLVISICGTLKALFWSLLLLLILMYMVGITLTQVVVDFAWEGDTAALETRGLLNFWGGLDISMFTLFQSISGGLSWREAVLPLQGVSVILVWVFVTYIAFTYFAVLNVMTGVFCNAAIESAQRNPDVIAQNLLASRSMYEKNLEKLFRSMDEDGDAVFTFSEFEQIITNPDNRAYLAALEIEAVDAWTLFKLMDVDRDGVIQKKEFIAGCMQLKGVARNIEIANLSRDVASMERRLQRFMTHMEGAIEPLRAQPPSSCSKAVTPVYPFSVAGS